MTFIFRLTCIIKNCKVLLLHSVEELPDSNGLYRKANFFMLFFGVFPASELQRETGNMGRWREGLMCHKGPSQNPIGDIAVMYNLNSKKNLGFGVKST